MCWIFVSSGKLYEEFETTNPVALVTLPNDISSSKGLFLLG